MKERISYLKNKLLNLQRNERRIILIICDAFLLIFTFLFFSLINPDNSYGNFFLEDLRQIFLVVLLTLFIFIFTDQYKGLTKYESSEIIYNQFIKNIFLILSLFIVNKLTNFKLINGGSSIILFSIIFNFFSITVRFFMRDALLKINTNSLVNVVIYGAGGAGAQLAASLRFNGKHKIVFFLDDNKELWGRTLHGYKIHSPEYLYSSKNKINLILLAIPSLNKAERKKILIKLSTFDLPVLQIPSIDQLTNSKAKIDTLIPIEITELLGRKQTSYKKEFLSNHYSQKVVCITGAAGSIGSGLCKQLLELNLKTLICLDISENGLYELDNTLNELNNKNTNIKLVLGCSSDPLLINSIFKKYKVQIVFHAAAYKHVPLVELNPIQGLNNNFFSTQNICSASIKNNVERVVLISSDKAVRPTNVMGASKRLAEIVFDYYHRKLLNKLDRDFQTYFTMVRFGNVLDSSGSVVPLFKKQIKNGGPLTITHENIYRYFMTIPEATSLVLHASVLSKGGELFLLDMGRPVRIKDLAEKMIRLSGLTIKNNKNSNGDIEIINTGLRPGEKLYEELLIKSDSSEPTSHPLIFKAKEGVEISVDKLEKELETFSKLLKKYDDKLILKKLKKLVPEWSTSIDINS